MPNNERLEELCAALRTYRDVNQIVVVDTSGHEIQMTVTLAPQWARRGHVDVHVGLCVHLLHVRPPEEVAELLYQRACRCLNALEQGLRVVTSRWN